MQIHQRRLEVARGRALGMERRHPVFRAGQRTCRFLTSGGSTLSSRWRRPDTQDDDLALQGLRILPLRLLRQHPPGSVFSCVALPRGASVPACRPGLIMCCSIWLYSTMSSPGVVVLGRRFPQSPAPVPSGCSSRVPAACQNAGTQCDPQSPRSWVSASWLRGAWQVLAGDGGFSLGRISRPGKKLGRPERLRQRALPPLQGFFTDGSLEIPAVLLQI